MDGVFADGQLKSLILQDCSVDDECMSTISQLSKLTQLRLVKSSIHDHHLRHLTHLYELKYLCLAHNEVTDNGIQHLLCLPQLSYQSYDLFATKVSNEMKAILPGR